MINSADIINYLHVVSLCMTTFFNPLREACSGARYDVVSLPETYWSKGEDRVVMAVGQAI